MKILAHEFRDSGNFVHVWPVPLIRKADVEWGTASSRIQDRH